MKMFMRPKTQTQSGFTLIELLVVIIIVNILSAIALQPFLRLEQRSSLKKLIDLTSAEEIVLNAKQMTDLVAILDGLSSESNRKKCLSGDELRTDPFYNALVSQGNTAIPSQSK